MHPDTIAVIETAAAASITGKMKFPQIVGQLAAAGVERYHVDYTRREKTFYLPDGDSHVVPLGHPVRSIATVFDAAAVKEAIRDSQQGRINYPQFIDRTTAAGSVGYFVQITGRQAIYFGRDGQSHIERFPTAAPQPAATT